LKSTSNQELVDSVLLNDVAGSEKALAENADPNVVVEGQNVGPKTLLCSHLHLIMHAVDQNNIEIVKLLLEHGSNPNLPSSQSDDSVDTPLQLAISKNYFEVSMILIEYGANLDHAAGTCLSPVVIAVENRNFKMLSALLDAGAWKDKSAYEGCDPRDMAEMRNCDRCLEVLMKYVE